MELSSKVSRLILEYEDVLKETQDFYESTHITFILLMSYVYPELMRRGIFPEDMTLILEINSDIWDEFRDSIKDYGEHIASFQELISKRDPDIYDRWMALYPPSRKEKV